MADTIRCPGCGRPIDVSGPPGAKYQIVQDTDKDGARYVEINIGRARVHRCLECLDGIWR